jgi:hypothetical protein
MRLPALPSHKEFAVKYLVAIVGLLAAASAHAGQTVTERPGNHELRKRGVSDPIGTFTTHQLCAEALAAIPLTDATPAEYTCKAVTHFTVTPNCDGVPPPAPVTDIVIELKPSIYAAPENNVREPWSVLLPDGTVKHTFTNVGAFRFTVMPDESTKTESYELRPTGVWPTCWEWVWVVVPPPAAPLAYETWTPPFDAETELSP